ALVHIQRDYVCPRNLCVCWLLLRSVDRLGPIFLNHAFIDLQSDEETYISNVSSHINNHFRLVCSVSDDSLSFKRVSL
ncbi:hypothetical protein PMAYCL1PPCAC_09287, partial [Pristionchus mayeri]